MSSENLSGENGSGIDTATNREPTVRDASEGAEIVGVGGYDLEDVDGGVLVYKPEHEYREHLGREVRTGRRLVGVAEVTDRLALRGELAKRGLDVGGAHDEVDLGAGR